MAKILENGKKSSAELKAAIEADRKERAQACAKEIEEVLKKYDCALGAEIRAQGNAAQAQPVIVPR